MAPVVRAGEWIYVFMCTCTCSYADSFSNLECYNNTASQTMYFESIHVVWNTCGGSHSNELKLCNLGWLLTVVVLIACADVKTET